MFKRRIFIRLSLLVAMLSLISVALPTFAADVNRGSSGDFTWTINGYNSVITYQGAKPSLAVSIIALGSMRVVVMRQGKCIVTVTTTPPEGATSGLAIISSRDGAWPLTMPAAMTNDPEAQKTLASAYMAWMNSPDYALLQPTVAQMISQLVQSSAPPSLIQCVVGEMVLPFGFGILPDQTTMESIVARSGVFPPSGAGGTPPPQPGSAMQGGIVPENRTGGAQCFDMTDSRDSCNGCCSRGFSITVLACTVDPALCGMALFEYGICNGLCDIAFAPPSQD